MKAVVSRALPTLLCKGKKIPYVRGTPVVLFLVSFSLCLSHRNKRIGASLFFTLLVLKSAYERLLFSAVHFIVKSVHNKFHFCAALQNSLEGNQCAQKSQIYRGKKKRNFQFYFLLLSMYRFGNYWGKLHREKNKTIARIGRKIIGAIRRFETWKYFKFQNDSLVQEIQNFRCLQSKFSFWDFNYFLALSRSLRAFISRDRID